MMKTILQVVIMMEGIVVEIMLRSIDVNNVNARNACNYTQFNLDNNTYNFVLHSAHTIFKDYHNNFLIQIHFSDHQELEVEGAQQVSYQFSENCVPLEYHF